MKETVISCHANLVCVITPTQDSVAREARWGRPGRPLVPQTHFYYTHFCAQMKKQMPALRFAQRQVKVAFDPFN